MIRKALFSPVILGSMIAWVSACGGAQPVVEPAPPPVSAVPETPKPVESAAPAPAPEPAKKEAEAPQKPEPIVFVKDAGFLAPESVIYDAANDVYLLSNVNGSPGAADNNGFISKVSPEGKVLDLKWAAGGAKGVKLDAPKGLAIVGGTLYVADLTVVRQFDLKTGKAKADIHLAGATFVNDVAAGPDGKVWVTDSGIKVNDKGSIDPTKTDSVWVIEKGKAKSVAKGEDLGHPNGIAVVGGAPWVVSVGGELYRIDAKGKRQDVQKAPKGELDGLIGFADGVLFTSWEASAVFRGKPGGSFDILVPDIKSPADIGFDTKRSRLLVPQMLIDSLAVYDVK